MNKNIIKPGMLRACVHTDCCVEHRNPDTRRSLLGRPLAIHDGNHHNHDTVAVVVATCCGVCCGDVVVVGQVVDGDG